MSAIPSSFRYRATRVLLACGILSPVLYDGTDILASLVYPEYSYRDQAVSELFAIGAPTTALVVPLFTLSSIALILFAIGASWSFAARARAVRVLALMMLGGAIVGLLIWNVFPMHMRGAERTLTDKMHLILAANPFILLAICAAAVAFPGRFRVYSIVTLVLLFVPAVFAFRLAPLVDANAPTPWLGISERFAQYETGVWQVVLAITLLRRQRREGVIPDQRLAARSE
jgi:hypothetical protein